jgi:hypothetical protein
MKPSRNTATVRAAQADVILVSSMTTPLDQGQVRPKFIACRETLKNLTSPQVALADVTTPFAELLKQ